MYFKCNTTRSMVKRALYAVFMVYMTIKTHLSAGLQFGAI